MGRDRREERKVTWEIDYLIFELLFVNTQEVEPWYETNCPPHKWCVVGSNSEIYLPKLGVRHIVVYSIPFRLEWTENLVPVCKPVRDNPPFHLGSNFGMFRVIPAISGGISIPTCTLLSFFFFFFWVALWY